MEEGGDVKLDRWGYQVKTSSDACISAINAYYHQVLTYGRRRSVIIEAPNHDGRCVLGNILAVHFLCSSDPSRAHLYLQAAKDRLEQATSYEKAVFAAVHSLICKERDDDLAFELHSELLQDFPRDLSSLKRAQVLCFYMGRPDLSLDLVLKVLPENQEEDYIYGMLAFPLLELGRIEEAEEAAKRGLEINEKDPWSQHNLCHVLQYGCRYKEAVEFMEKSSSSWGSLSSFMYTHNWWHVALCYLEGHAPIGKVIDVYDQCIWKELERDDSVCAEVYLNALGLLLRVYVRGLIPIFEDNLKILAARLTDQTTWYLEWHLDVLTLWALAYTKEFAKAEDLLQGLKNRFSKMSKKKQQAMQRVMLLAQGLYEYGRGNDKVASELLGPEFDANHCKILGASDEQLDVFNEVLFSALLNSGQVLEAIEAIQRRVKTKEGDPFLWRLLERGYSMAGREEAIIVGRKAGALETAHFY